MTDHDWWEDRWRRGRTGWQVAGPHPLLRRWWPALAVPAGARVLVPLAGASDDIDWLLARGYRVDAVEISETAIARYFAARDADPERSRLAGFPAWCQRRLRFVQADFLALGDAWTPRYDAVYDRAALIALDAGRRPAYAREVMRLCAVAARMLLITLEFPAWLRAGPPHSVQRAEVEALYGPAFAIRVLGQRPERALPQREVVYAMAARPERSGRPSGL